MISREVLVDVLRSHCRRRNGPRDMHTHCLCGWSSDQSPGQRVASGPGQHVQHQADMVLAAVGRSEDPIVYWRRDDSLNPDVLWTVQKDAVGNERLMPYEDTLDDDERHDR